MEITLIGLDEEIVPRVQDKMTKHLSRCVTSAKLTHSEGIFHGWNQHLINSFYKYCKDQCILPKYDPSENILELIGPVCGIQAVKKKWHMLTELVKHAPVNEHSNYLTPRSGAKLYNIVLSYSSKDIRRCQRLINRLTEEGFSLGIDANRNDKQRGDLSLLMTRCDCIILCISENYYMDSTCLEEAKYAFQTAQPVFLVKIRSHPVLGWDYHLFEGKLFFRLFGSEEFFDFEYGRLLLHLVSDEKDNGFDPCFLVLNSYDIPNRVLLQFYNDDQVSCSKISRMFIRKKISSKNQRLLHVISTLLMFEDIVGML